MKRSNKVKYKKYALPNVQEQAAQSQTNTFNVLSDITREIYNARMDRFITNGSTEHALIIQQKKFDAVAASPASDELLKGLIGLTLPKSNTPSNLMHSTVNRAIKYTYQKTPYRNNLYEFNQSLDALKKAIHAGNATAYIFDLETVTGKNAKNKEHYTAITELSIKSATLGTNGKFLETAGDSIEGIIGFNAEQESNIRSMFGDYLSGKRKIDPKRMSEEQRVAFTEILNFDYAFQNGRISSSAELTGGGFRLYKTKSKLSREELDTRVKSMSQGDLIQSLDRGISKLREVHDSSDADMALKEYARRLQSVDGKSTFAVGANIRQYDINVSRALGILNQEPARKGVIDITELAQHHNAMTRSSTRAGAQQSNVFKQLGLSLPDDMVPHIASTDTYMSLGILNKTLDPGGWIDQNLAAEQNRPTSEFKIGGIYRTGDTITAPISFGRGKDGTIISSTGYTYDPLNKKQQIRRNYGYNFGFQKDMSYELTGHEVLDISQLSDKQKASFREIAGDKYLDSKNLHVITMAPILDASDPEYTTESFTRSIILNENDFQAAIGAFEHVGNVKTTKSGVKTNVFFAGYTPSDIKNGAAIETHSLESTVRSFEDNQFRMLSSMHDYTSVDIAHKELIDKLSSAIATGDQKQIDAVRSELAKSMHAFYAKKSNGIELTGKMAMHAESFANMSELVPVFQEYMRTEHGISDVSEYTETFNKALQSFTDNLTIRPDGKIQNAINVGHMVKSKPVTGDVLTFNIGSLTREAAQHSSMTLNFNDYRGENRYKLAERLWSASGYKASDFKETDEYKRVQLLRNFTESLINEDVYSGVTSTGIDIKKNQAILDKLVDTGILNFNSESSTYGVSDIFDGDVSASQLIDRISGSLSDESVKYLKETQDKSSVLSTMIYDALKDSGVRTTSAESRMLPELKEGMWWGRGDQAVQITSIDQAKELFKKTLEATPVTRTIPASYALSKKQKQSTIDNIVSALVDDDIDPIHGSKFRNFLSSKGFTQEEIQNKAITMGNTISEYQDYLNYLVSAYSEAGIDFAITDNGIYARDSASKYVKLKLPEIRRYNNGAVYIRYGGQDVAIESAATIRDGQIKLRSQFSTRAGKVINHSPRTIAESERLGNKVTIETLTHQIQEDFRYNIAQAGEAFHETASNRFTSGGTLNVVDIISNMFGGQGSLEAIGALDRFASESPTDFHRMKDLFADFKQRNATQPINDISSIGQEFYELFTANAPTIFNSIAQSDAVADQSVKNIFAHLAPFATQEKTMAGGSYFIGTPRYATALSGFFNQKRNTGFQNAKSPMSMSATKLKNINGVRTGRTVESADMLKAFSGDTDMVDSVRIKMAHMTQREMHERLQQYVDSGDIAAAYSTYSKETTGAALGILMASNVENDGAFVSGELARALPQANVNTKAFDLTKVNFNGIRTKDKHDVIKGQDMIPRYSIDPRTGAVQVHYSKDFFIKQGENLVMLEKDQTAAAQLTKTYTSAQKNYIASVRYYNENGIELSEKQVNEAIASLHLDPSLMAIGSDTDEIISKTLKSKGITSTLKLRPIDVATKIGYGEEKTFATPLLLAFGQTKTQQDIISKYTGKDKRGLLDAAKGHILSQDALDTIAEYVNMSDEDYKTIQQEMLAPTMLWRHSLKGTSAADALLFTNINEVKHQSISDAASIMTQDIIDVYKNDPDKINGILTKVYGKNTVYDSQRQSVKIDPSMDYINMDELTKAYKAIPRKQGDVLTSTVSIISADDWKAGKFSGSIAKDLEEVQKAYLNGDITADVAHQMQNQIKQQYIQDAHMEGFKLSQQEKDIFGSYKYNNRTLSTFIGQESDDTFISNTQKALEHRGVLTKLENGSYTIADKYSKNTEPIYSGTYAAIDRVMKGGYNYEISTNPLEVADRKYQAKETIDDYLQNIKPINDTDNFAIQERMIEKSGLNKISASQMAIPTGDIAEEMLKDPNNPFTNNSIIDLGEKFGKDRYLAVKGLDPKFYNGTLIKTDYQKTFSSIKKDSEMLSLLDKDQLDRRIIESKFGVNSNLTKSEMQEKLQKSILDNKQQILQQQANLLGGKNSVMASLMSDRADVSGMFESQTATIPVGSMMDNLYDNLSFEGTSLKEHVSKGHYIDFAVINTDDIKSMGILDKADEYVDYLKKDRSDFYKTLIGQVGEGASNADIMMQAMKTEGINMYTGRYPTVHEQSVMGVRMYASDDVQKSTIRLPQWTQKKMKNDNDSDKVSVFNLSDYFMTSQQEDTTNIVIQAAGNKTIGDKIVKDYQEGISSDNFDPVAAVRERTAFGYAYRNISDSYEYDQVQNRINQSQYKNEFMNLYSQAQNAAQPKEGLYADTIFEDLVHQRQVDKGYASNFAEEMKSLYIGKHRLDEALVAEVAQSSKGKVGFINNAVSMYTSIGKHFTTGMISQVGDDADQKLKYEAAYELFNRQRGDLIENVINAKNTAGANQLTIVSDMINNMGILEREYDQEKVGIAKKQLSGIIDTAIGSKYDDYIADAVNQNTPIAKYLTSQGFDLNDKSQMADMRASLINLGVDTMGETSRKANIDYIQRARVGTSIVGGNALDKIHLGTTADNDITYDISYDMTLHDNITQRRASQQFIEDNSDTVMRTAKIDTESIAKEASENVAKATSSAASGSTAKVLSQAMKNNVSKNLALGALGVATSVLAVGIIGGNPSHAPQEDTQAVPQDAYRYDNFDYGTGTVIQQPQMHNQGYVVNMRASTNGSYSSAQRSMIQSAQQSYGASGGNMNVSVRQNFSYSANQDNDKYVEGILNRLM